MKTLAEAVLANQGGLIQIYRGINSVDATDRKMLLGLYEIS